mmetsp:Transcript_3066/g.4569  ORF Transcript_3066/g.4569 Transcript_3066/m.4569 type:complete len:655 (+) Transcript_3066:73-2037(+)
MASAAGYEAQKKAELEVLRNALNKGSPPEQFQTDLTATFVEGQVQDRTLLQLVFRIVLEDEMKALEDKGCPNSKISKLVELGVWCSEHKLLDEESVVGFLEDILDFQTVKGCERIFPFIELNLQKVLTPKLFVKKTQLRVLKICNMLLKRLSKTTDTSLCGRVLILLAKTFDLDERSAVNCRGTFNVSNITPIEDVGTPALETPSTENTAMEVDEDDKIEVAKANASEENKSSKENGSVNTFFYKSIWGLQKFFVDPRMLGDEDKRSEFENTLEQVLNLFEGNRVDYITDEGEDNYYPKYLTGSRLLELQLQDATFRRNLLTQLELLFTFVLSTTVSRKIQLKQPSMDASVKSKLKTWRSRVRRQLSTTPPNGDEFGKRLNRILKREQFWSKWKDNGCKNIVNGTAKSDFSKSVSLQFIPQKKEKIRGRLIFRRNESERLNMGDPILYKDWKLNGDDLTLLAVKERIFRPETKVWLKKAIDDEKNPDVKKSRRFNDVYAWRALRLMSNDHLEDFVVANGNIEDRHNFFCLENVVTGEIQPKLKKMTNRAKEVKEVQKKSKEEETNAEEKTRITSKKMETENSKKGGKSSSSSNRKDSGENVETDKSTAKRTKISIPSSAKKGQKKPIRKIRVNRDDRKGSDRDRERPRKKARMK